MSVVAMRRYNLRQMKLAKKFVDSVMIMSRPGANGPLSPNQFNFQQFIGLNWIDFTEGTVCANLGSGIRIAHHLLQNLNALTEEQRKQQGNFFPEIF